MLQSQSDEIQLYYDRAVQAKQRAGETTDSDAKADFLNLERRWRRLASNYELIQGSKHIIRAMLGRPNASTPVDFTKSPRSERPLSNGQEDLNKQLASIVVSSDDAIVSKDLNGLILTWNKGAERIFGYTAEEVVGKSISILM